MQMQCVTRETEADEELEIDYMSWQPLVSYTFSSYERSSASRVSISHSCMHTHSCLGDWVVMV